MKKTLAIPLVIVALTIMLILSSFVATTPGTSSTQVQITATMPAFTTTGAAPMTPLTSDFLAAAGDRGSESTALEAATLAQVGALTYDVEMNGVTLSAMDATIPAPIYAKTTGAAIPNIIFSSSSMYAATWTGDYNQMIEGASATLDVKPAGATTMAFVAKMHTTSKTLGGTTAFA